MIILRLFLFSMSFKFSLVRNRGLSDSVRKVKIGLIGARNVGKTSIALRYIQKGFRESRKGSMKKFTKHMGDFFVEILEECVDEMNLNNLSSFDAFILVYSVEDMVSFDCLSDLRDTILSSRGETVPIVVAGNKSDLTIRKVHSIMADCIVTIDWEHPHFEVSAKTNHSITQLFKKILDHPNFKRRQSPVVSMVEDKTDNHTHRRSSVPFQSCRSKQLETKVSIAEEESTDFEMPRNVQKPGLKSRMLNFFSSKSRP